MASIYIKEVSSLVTLSELSILKVLMSRHVVEHIVIILAKLDGSKYLNLLELVMVSLGCTMSPIRKF